MLLAGARLTGAARGIDPRSPQRPVHGSSEAGPVPSRRGLHARIDGFGKRAASGLIHVGIVALARVAVIVFALGAMRRAWARCCDVGMCNGGQGKVGGLGGMDGDAVLVEHPESPMSQTPDGGVTVEREMP